MMSIVIARVWSYDCLGDVPGSNLWPSKSPSSGVFNGAISQLG